MSGVPQIFRLYCLSPFFLSPSVPNHKPVSLQKYIFYLLQLTKRTIRGLTYVLSALVLGILLWQLHHLATELDTVSFRRAVTRPENGWLLLVVLLLMPANWLLETKKWQLLLRPFHAWSFKKCLWGVLAGVSVSAATPNRIGEIGGRMLMARKHEIPGVLASSLLGSLAQWLAFLTLAFPALVWVSGAVIGEAWQAIRWFFLPLGPLLILLLWWGGKPLLISLLTWLEKRGWLQTSSLNEALANVNFALIIYAGAWAALRFIVYVIQLYLLLSVFGLTLPFWWGLAGIAAIYLIQAGIPLPPGVNLVTRAELGILLWGNQPEVTAASLAAFGGLFLVNVLLPALPAYWLIVKKINTT